MAIHVKQEQQTSEPVFWAPAIDADADSGPDPDFVA